MRKFFLAILSIALIALPAFAQPAKLPPKQLPAKKAEMSYAAGVKLAVKQKSKLIVYVGINAPTSDQATKIGSAVICTAAGLEDFPPTCIVICEPDELGWVKHVKTLPWNATAAQIKEEVSRTASPFAQSSQQFGKSTADAELHASVEALDEVNEARRQLGLRPFLRDDGLIQAAKSAAAWRAARRVAGHCPNDFAHLPQGSDASAADCAAWPQGMGWGSCCWRENWTYAGAAWCIGPDNLRYMHIFVR